jgi:AcrR family transcriptional regulator
MVVESTRDRRAERREATRAEILDTAWELARTRGLTGFSLRDVARQIGMRPPSLYWYFESKQAVYDAMFVQGNQQLIDRMHRQRWPTDARGVLRLCARGFVEFCVEDLQRYQLLFQRSIPDFEPSAEAYAVAVSVMEQMRALLATIGLTRAEDFDLWTALVAGLAAQQASNDPGGDRWLRLTDTTVDMFISHVLESPTPTTEPTPKRRQR